MLPDSSVIKGRNPFFLPEFEGGAEMSVALAVRIDRLGKGISPRFAYRYWTDLAPAFIIRAEKYAEILRSQGLPDSPAYAFDRAILLGDFQSFDSEDVGKALMSLTAGEEIVTEGFIPAIAEEASEVIPMLSRDNTLKTGDIVFLPFHEAAPRQIRIGEKYSLNINLFNQKEQLLTTFKKFIRIL